MTERLRETARRLLAEGTVQVVIGYGAAGRPVLITRPEDVDQLVWNDRCLANLTVYLTRKEVKALGKAAIVVKGCDERALVVLEKESQIDRAALDVIGLACDGVGAAEVRTLRGTHAAFRGRGDWNAGRTACATPRGRTAWTA